MVQISLYLLKWIHGLTRATPKVCTTAAGCCGASPGSSDTQVSDISHVYPNIMDIFIWPREMVIYVVFMFPVGCYYFVVHVSGVRNMRHFSLLFCALLLQPITFTRTAVVVTHIHVYTFVRVSRARNSS